MNAWVVDERLCCVRWCCFSIESNGNTPWLTALELYRHVELNTLNQIHPAVHWFSHDYETIVQMIGLLEHSHCRLVPRCDADIRRQYHIIDRIGIIINHSCRERFEPQNAT